MALVSFELASTAFSSETALGSVLRKLCLVHYTHFQRIQTKSVCTVPVQFALENVKFYFVSFFKLQNPPPVRSTTHETLI